METKEIPHINLVSRIKDLRLTDCNIANTVPSSLVGKFDVEKVQFEFNIGVRMDVVKKSISITLITNFYADEPKTIKLGHINTEGDFEISNLDEIISTFEGKIPSFVFANFMGVVIGTTRGLLMSKAEGTIMQGIYLPMINPLSLLPQPLEV